MRDTITYIVTVWAFTIAAIAGLFALDPGTPDPAGSFDWSPGTIVMTSDLTLNDATREDTNR